MIESEKLVSDKIIQEERNLLINKNEDILKDLARFLNNFKNVDAEEDDEEADYDDDEVEAGSVTHSQEAKALVEYQKFLKKLARYHYLKKTFLLLKNYLGKIGTWKSDMCILDNAAID